MSPVVVVPVWVGTMPVAWDTVMLKESWKVELPGGWIGGGREGWEGMGVREMAKMVHWVYSEAIGDCCNQGEGLQAGEGDGWDCYVENSVGFNAFLFTQVP
jgi:hypothetical protein